MLSSEIYKILKRRNIWIFYLILVLYLFVLNLHMFFPNAFNNQKEANSTLLENNLKGTLDDELVSIAMMQYKDIIMQYVDEGTHNFSYFYDMGSEGRVVAYFYSRFFSEDGRILSVQEAYPNIDFELTYGHFTSWNDFFYFLESSMKLFAVFIILTVAPLFSYESQCGMNGVLLSTKNGRKKCTQAKIKAGILITNIGGILYIFLLSTIYLSCYGIEGYDTSIQVGLNMRETTLHFTYLSAYFHSIFLDFLSINTILLISLFISFKSKSPFKSMCILLGILYIIRLDVINTHIKQPIIERIASLHPINIIENYAILNFSDIHLFGLNVPWLYLVEGIYTLFLLIGFYYFANHLSKNQKYFAE